MNEDKYKGQIYVKCYYPTQLYAVLSWKKNTQGLKAPPKVEFNYPVYVSLSPIMEAYSGEVVHPEVEQRSISFGDFKSKYFTEKDTHKGPYLGVTQDMLSGEVMTRYDHLEELDKGGSEVLKHAPLACAPFDTHKKAEMFSSEAEQDFEEVIKQTLAACKEVMISKGREYRRNNDPFHNFNQGAKLTGKTREEVIWGFALKHFISVQDIKADMLQGKMPTEALLNEKYGDLLNYLLIEKASIMSKIR